MMTHNQASTWPPRSARLQSHFFWFPGQCQYIGIIKVLTRMAVRSQMRLAQCFSLSILNHRTFTLDYDINILLTWTDCSTALIDGSMPPTGPGHLVDQTLQCYLSRRQTDFKVEEWLGPEFETSENRVQAVELELIFQTVGAIAG